MSNPLKQIVKDTGKKAYALLEDELKGVVSNVTFYNLLDDRWIPAKAQWGTVKRVTEALGYEIVFQKVDEK